MDKQRLEKLIDKVLSGRASVQEQQELDEWYAAQEGEKGLTDELSEQHKATMGKQLFQSIEGRLQTEASETEALPAIEQAPVRNYSQWVIAAAVLILVAVGAFYFFGNQPAPPAIAAVWKETATRDAIKEIRLPDQSVVWLNAGSSIRYDSNFTSGKRAVWLQGEAYFDVAHMEGKTFEVHTGNITTRVLGTAFNIDAYAPADHITVTVQRGKVVVSDSLRELATLLPDQRLVCLADGSIKKDSALAADYTAWAAGQLIFREMKFSEVAGRLERKFGVQLHFRDTSIGNCLITASFEPTTSLKDILDMLALTNGSTIQAGETPNVYYISGKMQCK